MVILNTGKFLKSKDLTGGETVKILTEGSWVENAKFKNEDGTNQSQFVISVQFKAEERNLRLNLVSRKNLIQAYGKDTAKWVGKEARIQLIDTMVSGEIKKSIVLNPCDPYQPPPTTPEEPWDK